MNDIKWTKKANKQLKKVATIEQQRIYVKAQELAQFPQCPNVKALTNRNDYRLRVGNYRIFFTVENGTPTIITIEQVRKRDERTY